MSEIYVCKPPISVFKFYLCEIYRMLFFWLMAFVSLSFSWFFFLNIFYLLNVVLYESLYFHSVSTIIARDCVDITAVNTYDNPSKHFRVQQY